MKRRLLSAFLAVMMVLTMAPVAFAADGVEPTDGTGFSEAAPAETLQAKIKVAAENDGTVTLDKDYTEDITIQQGQNITLNLNGKKLTNKTGHTITVEQGATLTIEGNGTVDNVTNSKTTVYNKGTVVLNGGTYTRSLEDGVDANNAGTNTSYTVLNHGKMTINGGVTIENKGHYSSMLENGYYDGYAASLDGVQKPEMVINGGTFDGGLNTVKNDDNATLTINDGSFSNYTQAAFQNHHVATINGGTFNAKGVYAVINCGSNCNSINEEHGKHFTQITGGIFNGGVMRSIGNIKITGGAFTADVSAYVAEGYVQSENGTVEQLGETNAVAKVGDTYYKTLSAAVAAAKDGDTVTLLNNTVEDVVIPADKTITLDLNGKKIVNSTTAQDSKVADDARKHTITNNGTLTIMDSVGGGVVDNVSHGRAALYNNGTITEIKGGKFTRSVDNSTDSESANGNSWYVVYNAEGATISKISNGEFLALGHFSSLFSNCGTIDEISGGMFTQDHFIAFKNEGTVNKISGGVFSSTDESCIQNWGTIGEICGGTITAGSLGIWNFSSDKYQSKGTVEKISDGVISGTKAAIRLSNYDVLYLNKSADSMTNKAFAKITGGKFNGALQVGEATELSIFGGDFSSDPSGYLAVSAETGKKYVAGAINESPYFFRVALVEDNQIPVVPAVGETAAPSAKELEKTGMTKEAAEAVAAAAKKVAAGDTEIKEAVAPIATGITDEKAEKYQQDAAKDVDDVKKIEVRAYLEVKPTAYNGSAYTLDITPKYDVVVVGTKNGATAKKVVETNTLNVTKATEVSVQLPADFVTNTNGLYVQHKGHEYDATVTANNGVYTANFTNPHGFSPFTISKTPQTVATIGTDKYTSFADAVSAVPANGTIEITGGTSPYTGTANKTFTVKNSTSDDITVNGQPIKSNESHTFKYTHSSGGSSGGSSSGKTTYKVTTSAVNNGGVNASPSSAEKGATITITLSPDKGYKLDKLTVTDGSGKTVSTVKKSDTVYTFTMPASAVKVGVSYVKATETPSETKFNDVSANDWFASAVDYVTGKGMMNGTAENTFSPKANTTRGMVVTVLYRLENQPSTSAASFTDVASGAYYANAVAWANANGIVSGYGSGKFGPNDKVTREQLAAILYRYAQYKKYDVSVGEDTNILSYDDAQSISTYAIPAIQWACGAGVVTGKSGSKLDPKGNATRAEVAAMLMRFCENVK